jgi:hypothetical protein
VYIACAFRGALRFLINKFHYLYKKKKEANDNVHNSSFFAIGASLSQLEWEEGASGKALVLRVYSLQGPRFNSLWVQTILWGHTPW